jgi:hypothetical protein
LGEKDPVAYEQAMAEWLCSATVMRTVVPDV